MKIGKISLAILILICAIGIVAAADVSNFKIPEGYGNLGNGNYMNAAEDIEIGIMSEKDIGDLNDAFKNNSDLNYTIDAGKLNNTFNYTDELNEMIGVNELVKINGKNYVIDVWTILDTKDISIDQLYDTLEEVNKLNNLKPVNPSTIDD